jgi:hypothetical protein
MIYAPKNDLVLTSNGELTITFDLSVFNNSAPVIIDWGDGTNVGVYFTDANTERQHIYGAAIPYTITISHANSISVLRFGYDHVSNLEGDVARLNVCGALETLWFGAFENVWTGTINGLAKTIKVFNDEITGGVNTGDIGLFSALTNFQTLSSPYTGTISLVNTPNIIRVALMGGNSDIVLDCTGLTHLTHSDSYCVNAHIIGDISLCVAIVQICWGGSTSADHCTLGGSIDDCDDLAYFDLKGNFHMTGSVTGKAAIYRFRSFNTLNAFTGSFAANIALQEVKLVDNSTIDKITSIDNKPHLGEMWGYNWTFTVAEVNLILAEKWADRNSTFGASGNRILTLNTAGSSAPTGQGITDRDALRLYRSPTPPGTAALWTILTN